MTETVCIIVEQEAENEARTRSWVPLSKPFIHYLCQLHPSTPKVMPHAGNKHASWEPIRHEDSQVADCSSEGEDTTWHRES